MTIDTESRALAALAEHEAITRQQTTPDQRMVNARRFLETLPEPLTESEQQSVAIVRDLFDFALERLRVNRGLMAAAKGVLDSGPSESFDLALVTDEDLLREVAARLKR